MKSCVFLLFIVFIPVRLISQDEVLLTINNQPVYRSEFERVYYKNNNIKGFENKPKSEYLEMFINFKLKVLEAKKLGFDTLFSFVNELKGYREQLSKPYLQNRGLIDRLIEEAYYRTINEVNASHIMIRLSNNPSPSDTLSAYNKIMIIRKKLVNGELFDSVAVKASKDPDISYGNLGWFSSFTMVYPFENAAYKTRIDSFSYPVRSRYGYHIIKVNGFRPSLGEIKLAHIIVRTGNSDDEKTKIDKKLKIDSCYSLLLKGNEFSQMVRLFSDDENAKKNKGQMRWIRSGELPQEIEDLVFSLNDSGSFTRPVKSDFGWHIFQLQGKRHIADLEMLKAQIEERIMLDERRKMTENSFINTLKNEYDFNLYSDNISLLTSLLDSSIYSGKWVYSSSDKYNNFVFSFANKQHTQNDLMHYISKSNDYNRTESFLSIIKRKLNEFSSKELLKFEDNQLENKYPEFHFLMEEYHDGILLFNIMDYKIWSKSASDSIALLNYYKDNYKKYFWKERADVSVYTVFNHAVYEKVIKLAKRRIKDKISAEEFIKLICPNDSILCIQIEDKKVEEGENLPLNGFLWKKGYASTTSEGDIQRILVVNDIIPPVKKDYKEIQGQVTADYQDYLDKQWISELRSNNQVVVNQEILKSIK